MKLTVEMPWEKDLSVNHMRYGAGGGYRKKEHVQYWVGILSRDIHSWMRTWGAEFEISLTKWGYKYKLLDAGLLTMPMGVTVDFRFPDKRKRDDHNFYKVICDAVAAGLGIDDKDIRISTGTIEVDKDNPGFTITVEDRE